jgi:uncharacterized damage-inducible protein DinB
MPTQQHGIAPVEGFSPAISFYMAGFEYARSKTRDLIKDLTPAEIAKRISPEIYSIGAITLHLCECEYYWFQSVVRERELSGEEQRFAHMFDAMENDVDRSFDAAYLLGKLNAIYEMTYEQLKTMDDADLDRYFASRYGDRDREFSLREILQRMMDHEANHRGQMAMIKRVIRGGPTL